MNPIASRSVIAVDKASDTPYDVVIEIYMPIVEEDGNAFCAADFRGLADQSFRSGGIDTMQALALTVREVRRRFEELQEQFVFLWPGTEDVMDSIDYFPKELEQID
jgi:hypothetical protein